MKKILPLLLIVSLTVSCDNSNQNHLNHQPNKNDETYLLTNHSAGPFVLSETIPDSVNGFKIDKTVEKRFTESGPIERPVYNVIKEETKIAALYTEYNVETDSRTQTIDEIMIFSPLFQTEEDIGVGSTLKEFVTVYPNYELWYTYVSDRYVLENNQQSIQFLLKEEDFVGEIGTVKSEKMLLRPSDFEDAQIYKIRVF